MSDIDRILSKANIHYFEYGITALDAYYDEKPRPFRLLAVQGSVVDLARIFADLAFPGLPYADAICADEARFLCVERTSDDDFGGPWLNFRRDPKSGTFFDKGNIYENIKKRNLVPQFPIVERALFDAALLSTLSEIPLSISQSLVLPPAPSAIFQRDLLLGILSGPYPASGFELLKQAGFIQHEWPELALLDDVDHSKDFHPEGNGWTHTMQTFAYRKDRNLALSLSLLLHDIGKPESQSRDGRRFDRHAELGAKSAQRFLSRLGFSESIKEEVTFLIRYHMMPAALSILPVQKTKQLISDPRFPALLELFRCDELSSYKGPERYYDACNAFQAIKRNIKNPYRNPDGSKKVVKNHSASHY